MAHPSVQVDLSRIRANAAEIRARTGVAVYAVVKADAYGLGAARVAGALAGVVDGFCCFSLGEVVQADLWRVGGKPIILLGPPEETDPRTYMELRVRPAVAGVEQARLLRAAGPILCVDTGMQRFACPGEQIDAAVAAGQIDEAFTHATRLEHVEQLKSATAHHGLRLHAAATSLLCEPAAWLSAVRPGLALYRDAVRVSAPLVEARDSHGPVGYSGFITSRHGIILRGYSHGLRRGPCLVNGRLSQLLEVGMQSSFVDLESGDAAGDEVVLLGDSLMPEQVAAGWGTSPHEVLVRLAASAPIEYIHETP